MNLDRTNLKILHVLQQEGRLTNQALADRVALSASACLSRTKWLEKHGYISGYHAHIDKDRIGSTLESFLEVTLQSHLPNDFKQFEAFINQNPEIIASYKMGATFDYLLHVLVKDMKQLAAFSDHILDQSVEIAKLTTMPVISQTKAYVGLPLYQLVSEEQVPRF